MVIPEYSLELVNKNGKIINKIENINFLKLRHYLHTPILTEKLMGWKN